MGVDRVVVAAPVPLAVDVPGGGQLRDDPMRRAFGDPNALADLAQANAGIAGYAYQDSGVVGQERPAGCHMIGHDTRISFPEEYF